ncbi:MAG TPA: hypothetical protein VI653_29780, partial [Steroidobacteraceae bacterium]
MSQESVQSAPLTVDFAALHQQQSTFCAANGYPRFAPRVCWSCRKEIYSHPRAQSAAANDL